MIINHIKFIRQFLCSIKIKIYTINLNSISAQKGFHQIILEFIPNIDYLQLFVD